MNWNLINIQIAIRILFGCASFVPWVFNLSEYIYKLISLHIIDIFNGQISCTCISSWYQPTYFYDIKLRKFITLKKICVHLRLSAQPGYLALLILREFFEHSHSFMILAKPGFEFADDRQLHLLLSHWLKIAATVHYCVLFQVIDFIRNLGKSYGALKILYNHLYLFDHNIIAPRVELYQIFADNFLL